MGPQEKHIFYCERASEVGCNLSGRSSICEYAGRLPLGIGAKVNVCCPFLRDFSRNGINSSTVVRVVVRE